MALWAEFLLAGVSADCDSFNQSKPVKLWLKTVNSISSGEGGNFIVLQVLSHQPNIRLITIWPGVQDYNSGNLKSQYRINLLVNMSAQRLHVNPPIRCWVQQV